MIYDYELPDIVEEAEQRGYRKAIDDILSIVKFYENECYGIYQAIKEIEQLKSI